MCLLDASYFPRAQYIDKAVMFSFSTMAVLGLCFVSNLGFGITDFSSVVEFLWFWFYDVWVLFEFCSCG